MSDRSPFLEGLRDGAIRFQACSACGAAQTLRRAACFRCGCDALDWRTAAGGGRVYALTAVHRAPSDRFRAVVPYQLALVDMDEGFRLMGHAEAGLAIGSRTRAAVATIADTRMVRFAPASEEAG